MSSTHSSSFDDEPCCSKSVTENIINTTFKELQEKQKSDANAAFARSRQFYQQQTQRNIDTSHLNFDKPHVIHPEADALPRTTPYNFARKNVRGEDFIYWDNVPYINDDVNIAELFPDYVSDVQEKESADIDESMLEELLVKVGNGKFEPSLFENVCETLSLNISPKKLHKKFAATYRDYHSTDQDNIDWEKSLENHQKHFCRRCFIYGCQLHKEESKFVENPHQLFSGQPEIEKPCSDDCYDSKTDVNNNDTSAQDWTVSDKTFCRVMQKTFPENYCAIAVAMQSKSCREVYEFLNKDKANEQLKAAENIKMKETKTPAKKSRKTKVSVKKSHILKEFKETPDYKPCDCKGDCSEDCPCEGGKNFCEKFCLCSHAKCQNRFPPCKCKAQCETNQCSCFLALRECDPDVCKCNINCTENDSTTCKNVQVQRGLKKHLRLAVSDVAGWGIFAANDIKKDEFISEYIGEQISQAEAERRGKVYDYIGHSFLFDLSKDVALDATSIGSKIRFANHSNNPNCYCKTLMVLGDKRIAIYAKKNIQAGEELFFDYGYDPKKVGKSDKK